MLPKIDYPIHNITVPSNKKKYKFRPFLVKEEKLLLMAKESSDETEYLAAMKHVINNCSLDKGFNINTLATFDIEYLFLKLRALSVDNIVKLSYVDTEDNKPYEFEIDLNNINVQFPENIDNNIPITKTIGIIMKYPPATLYDDKKFLKDNNEPVFELIIKCLDKIYDGDSIYEAKDYKRNEIIDFLESLDIPTFEKVNKFLINTPKLYHKIEYKNSLDHDRVIELISLKDFFM